MTLYVSFYYVKKAFKRSSLLAYDKIEIFDEVFDLTIEHWLYTQLLKDHETENRSLSLLSNKKSVK